MDTKTESTTSNKDNLGLHRSTFSSRNLKQTNVIREYQEVKNNRFQMENGQIWEEKGKFREEISTLKSEKVTLKRNLVQALEDAFKCPICLNTLKIAQDYRVLEKCGHLFCENCISKNAAYSRRCPLCRKLQFFDHVKVPQINEFIENVKPHLQPDVDADRKIEEHIDSPPQSEDVEMEHCQVCDGNLKLQEEIITLKSDRDLLKRHVVKALEDSFKCPGCRQSLNKAQDYCVLVDCSHLFCGECVSEIYENKDRCPICQTWPFFGYVKVPQIKEFIDYVEPYVRPNILDV